MSAPEPVVYEFGDYRLEPTERRLSHRGHPVALTDKVFELLLVLLENRGHVVTKAELMQQLWPDAVVEENNLTVNMSILRKALGETAGDRRYIETLSRRGYRFVAEVRTLPFSAGTLGAKLNSAEAHVSSTSQAKPQDMARAGAFVGRGRELARLEQLLARAVAGEGRVVFITGPAGMGKTELSARFLASIEDAEEPALVAVGHSLEQYGPSEAYLPFLEVVRHLSSSSTHQHCVRILEKYAPSWCRQIPSPDTLRLPGTGPSHMLRELAEALEEVTRVRPLVLLLEDVHWADPSSCDLLRMIAERSTHWRLLVLATLRAEQAEFEKHPLANIKRELLAHDRCDEIVLPLLGVDCTSSYLDVRFQPHRLPAELADWMSLATEGQPLFLTRLVDLLVERGDLALVDGHYQLTRPVSELHPEVPYTVRGLIERKLESLADEELRTLEHASVAGAEFSSALVSSLLTEDEVLSEERLDKLARTHRLVDLVGEERLQDGQITTRYRFAHVLYQRVLYDRLASKRRTILHAKVAHTLLRQLGDGACCVAARLAHHFELGREFEPAIRYLMLAADNAARLQGHREAKQQYERALAIVSELPAIEQNAYRIILLYNRGWCRLNDGEAAGAIEDFNAMLEHAQAPVFSAASEDAERTRALVFEYFAQPWKDVFGLQDMARMPNQDRSLGASAIRCEAYVSLCCVHFHTRQPQAALTCAEEFLRCAQESQNEPRRAEALAWIGACELELHRNANAIRYLEQSIALARSLAHPRALSSALCDRARLHGMASELALAEAAYAECLELSVEVNGRIYCLLGLGRVRTQLGHISAALRAFEEGIQVAMQAERTGFRRKLECALGDLFFELGQWVDAKTYYQRALDSARKGGKLSSTARPAVGMARVATALGDSSAAAAALRQADAAYASVNAAGATEPRPYARMHLERAQAEHQLALGNLEVAESHAQAFEVLATSIANPRYRAISRHTLARIRLERGDFALARTELESGLDVLSDLTLPLIRWRLLADLGDCRHQTGERSLAHTAFEQAQALVEQVAGRIEDASLRHSWLNSPAVRRVSVALG